MCPPHEISRLQCSLAGLDACGACARVESSADGCGGAGAGAALVAPGNNVDVLGTTLGEIAGEAVDPMTAPRSPTREDISGGVSVRRKETSNNHEFPTCQKLGAAHRWPYRVRSQRAPSHAGTPLSLGARRVPTPNFCLPTSLRSTFECA